MWTYSRRGMAINERNELTNDKNSLSINQERILRARSLSFSGIMIFGFVHIFFSVSLAYFIIVFFPI